MVDWLGYPELVGMAAQVELAAFPIAPFLTANAVHAVVRVIVGPPDIPCLRRQTVPLARLVLYHGAKAVSILTSCWRGLRGSQMRPAGSRIGLVAIALIALGNLFASCALAADLVWRGDVTLPGLDCAREKVDGIVISGAVTLHNPTDADPFGPIQEIIISCANLVFETGSSLSSISALDIRISELTSGPVKIINTRGVKGKDVDNGPAGDRRGPSGCVGRDNHDWGRGGNGERGYHGGNGGDVVLISKAFSPGTTIEVISNGGNGGSGGVGRNGDDGGHGGDGGNGGNITVALQEDGGTVPAPVLQNFGGRGGPPGCGNRVIAPGGFSGQSGADGQSGRSSF